MLKEDKLQGEVIPLRTVCMVLIATHPDKARLHAKLPTMEEQTMANALAGTAPDDALRVAGTILSGTVERLARDMAAGG